MNRRASTIRAWAVIFWLLVWQGASMALAAAYPHGELLLASPFTALSRLAALAITADFWHISARSTVNILAGFLLASVLGTVLAAVSARHRRVEELLAPLVAAIKAVPVASFIILALVWLPSRRLSLFISALMVFPPMYLNVLEGARRTDRALTEMARVFRVPLTRRLRWLYLPQVLPYFRSAAGTALGLCWKAGTAAEVIGVSGGTIGERLYTAKIYFQTGDLFAWTAMIVLISALFERIFLRLVDAVGERMGA